MFELGAVPVLRRILTPFKSVSAGFVQFKAIWAFPAAATKAVTGPGGVLSHPEKHTTIMDTPTSIAKYATRCFFFGVFIVHPPLGLFSPVTMLQLTSNRGDFYSTGFILAHSIKLFYIYFI
ncbi:MAG: hypothetical protein BWX80_01634 [Candidatus Hydrogenedentes bacterium ADurb.Bin101]|nr:MAG: hypothetical protein BWX80_01634 [Candidatus Hydrogenedentes bacterium ADurb.Bin101]